MASTATFPTRASGHLSGGIPIIVVQQTTQPFFLLDRASISLILKLWVDQLVLQALMIALRMVINYESMDGRPEGVFAKEDQPIQAGFFDGANESLGVGVQIGGSRRASEEDLMDLLIERNHLG